MLAAIAKAIRYTFESIAKIAEACFRAASTAERAFAYTEMHAVILVAGLTVESQAEINDLSKRLGVESSTLLPAVLE